MRGSCQHKQHTWECCLARVLLDRCKLHGPCRRSRRERSHPLEEEGVLFDRLGTGSSGSPLSSGSAASIELPHHSQRQQLQRPGALQPAAEEAGGGGEEGESLLGRGAGAGGGG